MSLDHANNWTDADWWSSDWSTDVLADPAWEQTARQLPPTLLAQVQCNPTHVESMSMFGGLSMCELSVDDERQQSEQDDGTEIGTIFAKVGMKFGFRTR